MSTQDIVNLRYENMQEHLNLIHSSYTKLLNFQAKEHYELLGMSEDEFQLTKKLYDLDVWRDTHSNLLHFMKIDRDMYDTKHSKGGKV